ncbi:MAG: preprotein translocase subunit SecE [Gammaproteobacteria bacterium]|nr:preprotein translocase subunit SecE [Gammaproteobacteria bacterium]
MSTFAPAFFKPASDFVLRRASYLFAIMYIACIFSVVFAMMLHTMPLFMPVTSVSLDFGSFDMSFRIITILSALFCILPKFGESIKLSKRTPSIALFIGLFACYMPFTVVAVFCAIAGLSWVARSFYKDGSSFDFRADFLFSLILLGGALPILIYANLSLFDICIKSPGIIVQYMYQPIVLIMVALLWGWVALNTNRQSAIVSFATEMRREIKRIEWPNAGETLRFVVIVAVAVALSAVFWWVIDQIITRVLSFLLNQFH